MASRRISDLHPKLQPIAIRFVAECAKQGVEILITCTWRSNQEQDLLYAQGRTKLGAIITNAKGGQSAHNVMLNGKPAAKAFDVVPVIAGKCIWDTQHHHWQVIGKVAEQLDLNWYGSPDAKFREYPHLQMKE